MKAQHPGWAPIVRSLLPKPLSHKVPRDHRETEEAQARRRQVVAAVGVTGATLLGLSLSSKPGSRRFFVLTLGVAATWAGGAAFSGPLHLGRIQMRDETLRRPVVTPVVTGVGAFGLFYAAAALCRHVPVLDRALIRVLRFADRGSTPMVVLTTCANGVAEELFFRGALYAAVGERHPVAKSTVAYSLATASTGNPALVLASAVMGVLFGLQRRASGGVEASALTHLTWSMLMLRYLPPLFRKPAPGRYWSRERALPSTSSTDLRLTKHSKSSKKGMTIET